MEFYWMSLETGELLRESEMIKQGREEHDLGDPLNPFDFRDYYKKTELVVDEDYEDDPYDEEEDEDYDEDYDEDEDYEDDDCDEDDDW